MRQKRKRTILSTGRIPRTVIMLGLVSLFTDAASEMIYPLVPVYVAALGSGAIILGVIEGIAETTASMVKLASGYMSDKSGKRKLLVLAGYALSSFFRPLTGIVSAAWQIVVIRMIDRIGKGVRTAPRDALIASSVDENIRGKAYGFHRAMDHTGAVIGPLLAIAMLLLLFTFFGVATPLAALRWTFLFSAIPGLLAVLTIIFFVNEVAPSKGSSKLFRISLAEFDSNFRNYLAVMVLFTLGNSSDAFLLYRVEESLRHSGAVTTFIMKFDFLKDLITRFGSVETQETVINILFLPLVWAFFHVIKVVFSTPLGALSDRIGRKRSITIGWVIYAFVYFSFAFLNFLKPSSQLLATFILFAIYALFYAFSEGAEKAFVADIVKDEYRGTAFGMFNFAIGIGALPASILFGFIYASFDKLFPGFGGTFAFSFGGTIAVISVILLSLRVREYKKERGGINQ
ncbi:MAG: MFS transporter [Bacteroidales bacterium]